MRTDFACTNLFFSVKCKPLPTGSSETESELWIWFWTANQNSCVRTDWIPTNVGQWLNRFLVRIESYFLLCIFYLAGFWLVEIVGSLFLSKSVFLPYCFWNILLEFTFRKEHDAKLPFLDILVEKTELGFETSAYRKPTFLVNKSTGNPSAHTNGKRT